MPYFAGIDLGTSSVKCFIADQTGQKISAHHVDYDVAVPQQGYAEQDPLTWWSATRSAISGALKKGNLSGEKIKAVGLSGQMHGTVLLGRKGNVLRPAILHCDGRAQVEVGQLSEWLGDSLFQSLYNPLFSGSQPPSVFWVKKHEPQLFEKITCILLPKDYIRYCLTGEIGTEITDASASLFYDIRHGEWSRQLLQLLGLSQHQFPQVSLPYDQAGVISQTAAAQTGLAAGTPVVFGAGDQAAQLLGNGVLNPGTATSNIGTSGQICTPSFGPVWNPKGNTNTFAHADKGMFYVMGAMLSAGLSLKWFTGQVLRDTNYRELDEQAAKLPVSAKGPVFLPYLCGERTPHLDASAKGVFFGLGLEHSYLHMYRAVMEGVVFALMDSMEILEALHLPIHTVVASGGGANSKLWLQIQADILGHEIRTTSSSEQAALGAVILAATGSGFYADLSQACEQMVHPGTAYALPDPERVCIYQELYQTYRALYPELKELY